MNDPDDTPLDLDETVRVLRDLIDALCVLGGVDIATLTAAGVIVELQRELLTLKVLTGLAEHLAKGD